MLEAREPKGRVGQQYQEIIGSKLNKNTKASIKAMISTITSEESLNAVNEQSNESPLIYAFYQSTEHLIGLCCFAEKMGYQFDQRHINNVFSAAMYRESTRHNRLISLQFLTSFFEVPQIIYYEAGKNADTQSLLTILSAAPPEKKAVALGESLCGVLEHSGKYSYLHIKLVFELGVNPHYRSFENGNTHNYMRSLCLWHADEDPSNQDLKRAELFSYLLKSLNSKVINSDHPKYTQSLLAYYKAEHRPKFFTIQELMHPAPVPEIDKASDDGNLLHWVSNCGHVEIIEDIVDSFIEHGYGKKIFVYNKAGGYTPLGCAVFKIQTLRRELTELAEDHEGRAEVSEQLELYKIIADKLVVAGLRLGKEGFRFSKLKPCELGYILQWLDSETTSKALNAQFKKYLRSLTEPTRAAVLEFLDPKSLSGTNFTAFQGELTTYFLQEGHHGRGLIHWVVEANHPELMTGILKSFCNHGIPIHSTNARDQSALELARQLGEREWMVAALESIPRAIVYHQVPSLVKMCMLKARQKVINSDETSKLSDAQLKQLEDVKPNFRFVAFLDHRYYSSPNRTLLMSLCANNEKDRLNTLLPLLTIEDIGTTDLKGNNVFHLVCLQQQPELLSILLNRCHSWAKNKQGETPLHILCRKGFLEMIDSYLLSVGFDYSGDRILTAKNNFGLIPLLCASNEVRNILCSKENFQSRYFIAAFQFVLVKELAEELLSCIDEMKNEGLLLKTGLPKENFIQALREDREKEYRYRHKNPAYPSLLSQFTTYLLSIGDNITQNSFQYRLLERLRSNPTFRVGLYLDEKLTKDFDAFATKCIILSELEVITGTQVINTAFDSEDFKKDFDESTKKWRDSRESKQTDNMQTGEIRATLAESLRRIQENTEKQTASATLIHAQKAIETIDKQGLDSQQAKLLEDSQQQVKLATKNPTNLANLDKLIDTAQKCEAEQSAVWISLGLALLGLVIAIVGALILAVSAGAISTVFLAPLSAVGGKVSTGMVVGGSVLLLAGIGLFCEDIEDNSASDTTHDYLEPSPIF
ncbi:MAG: ankyrin repeat domain-containing protein [Gammaproteobacteria bacterium]|nr:ankyrin repeat domain-containing protein [Gammaproteobacteria bacterium]